MKRIRMVGLIGAICLSVGFAQLSHAEIYRWVDENGNMQMSDKPPENQVQEVNSIREEDLKTNTVSEQDSVRQNRQHLLRSYDEENAFQAKKQQERNVEQQKLAKDCKKLQGRLNKLNGGRRLYENLDNGERKYMDDASRDKLNKELSAEYAKYCS